MRFYRIVNDTGVGSGTKVVDAAGNELGGVTSIEIDPIVPGVPITARVGLWSRVAIEAGCRLTIDGREIKSITFVDGESVDV